MANKDKAFLKGSKNNMKESVVVWILNTMKYC